MNVSQADTAKVEREVNIALHMRCHPKFPERFRVFEGALAIDRQAAEPEPEEVRARLNAVQQTAKARQSVVDHSKFAKIRPSLLLPFEIHTG